MGGEQLEKYSYREQLLGYKDLKRLKRWAYSVLKLPIEFETISQVQYATNLGIMCS